MRVARLESTAQPLGAALPWLAVLAPQRPALDCPRGPPVDFISFGLVAAKSLASSWVTFTPSFLTSGTPAAVVASAAKH